MPYVSITGLKLKSVLRWPQFMWFAIRAMNQAKKAEGNISADARSIDGMHHTLSVWQSEAHMRAYLGAGAHLHAMKNFRQMASGSTYGYESVIVPSWAEALELWRKHAKPV